MLNTQEGKKRKDDDITLNKKKLITSIWQGGGGQGSVFNTALGAGAARCTR